MPESTSLGAKTMFTLRSNACRVTQEENSSEYGCAGMNLHGPKRDASFEYDVDATIVGHARRGRIRSLRTILAEPLHHHPAARNS